MTPEDLRIGDKFQATYNDKFRVAEVVNHFEHSVCCAILDSEFLAPTGDYRTFTTAKLENFELISAG